jgi:cell wall-associated NlpC family hydrolase
MQREVGALLADARRLIGVPYVWGGTSAQGADCSGFVWLVYARRLPGLPRTSFEMFRVGTPVGREDLLPGDLVFFTTYAPGPSHVGVYMGNGQFAHASSRSRRVVVTPLSDPYYAARYLGARRILP